MSLSCMPPCFARVEDVVGTEGEDDEEGVARVVVGPGCCEFTAAVRTVLRRECEAPDAGAAATAVSAGAWAGASFLRGGCPCFPAISSWCRFFSSMRASAARGLRG